MCLVRNTGAGVIKLVEAARQHAGELILVATGPLTNVALACKLDPDFVGNGALPHPADRPHVIC